MYAVGAAAVWVSPGRQADTQRSFGNTLQEEARPNLALLDDQLSITKHSIIHVLGAVSLVPENNRGGFGLAIPSNPMYHGYNWYRGPVTVGNYHRH